jgi:uncharacterized DUF497 family protein
MEFEWDERKGARNAEERGLPFELAAAIFRGPVLEWEDRREDYGERRFIVIGEVEGRYLACVYTPRRGRRRIISLRLASRGERRDYREAFDR